MVIIIFLISDPIFADEELCERNGAVFRTINLLQFRIISYTRRSWLIDSRSNQ